MEYHPVAWLGMCGIIAVLRRPSVRPAPDLPSLLAGLDPELEHLVAAITAIESGATCTVDDLVAVAERLESVDRQLRGVPGVACLLSEPDLSGVEHLADRADQLARRVTALDQALDAGQVSWPPESLEELSAVVIRLRDVIWALRHDRTTMARAVAALAAGAVGPPAGASDAGAANPRAPSLAALGAYWAIEVALSAIDRLEVRGRDSAGLHLLVSGHGLDLRRPDIQALLGARARDPLFTSLAVRTPCGHLSLVYKAAAEIGELGDNTRALRSAITADPLLHLALSGSDAEVSVLGHTRWASVGIVSQPNAHPLNGEEAGGSR